MEEKITPSKGFDINIQELWLYRELFYFFTWRDIKIKYKQTLLGFLWAILQPLLLMVVFSYFFGQKLKVPSDNIPYPIFVYSGLMLWNLFSTGVAGAGNSMVNNSNIIKKIYFPRIIIPLSSVLVALFDFLMAFVIFIGILIYYQYNVDIIKVMIFLPICLLWTISCAFGLGSLLAAMNVKYRDIKYVIPFAIQMLLFLTPVIYPVSLFEEKWMQMLFSLNPMAGAISLIRSLLTDTAGLEWSLLVPGGISTVALLLYGIYYFGKTEAKFADIA